MSGPCISITVDAMLGMHIKDICLHLQMVADNMGIQARCLTNDTMLYANPGGSGELLYANYQKQAAVKGIQFRRAHSWEA